MFLSNQKKRKAAGRRKKARKTTSRKRTRSAKSRTAAPRSRTARRDWNRNRNSRGKLSSLSSFLPILERRGNKHHVVSFDPEEREASGAPTRRAARRSSRGRRTGREDEEDIEEVQSTSRRRKLKGAALQEAEDKISIEVGSVKALSTKYGIVRGMTWMVILATLLWWVPVLGPATVGYVGGRKSGGPFRAGVAALIPLLFVFGAVAVATSSAENVPLTIKHYMTEGYQAVLGGLPFDFPLLTYVFSNLGAVMASGPDQLFMVLAFALVGGSVTQMRIHERSVPPITARLPKHRLVQGPARSYENANEALEMLVARLASVVDRAERKGSKDGRAAGRSGPAAADGPDGRPRQHRGWSSPLFTFGRRGAPESYPEIESTGGNNPPPAEAAPAVLDAPSRQVVSSVLAATAPQAKGRAAKKAVRAARPVELGIPQTLAFADPAGAENSDAPLGSAHVYRPSKLYHIYGGTVNPIARKKLERRLRHTHTLHAMRRSARSLVKQPQALPRSERGFLSGADDLADSEPQKPRSLESGALSSSLHYDALEHLENASLAPAAAGTKGKHKRKGSPARAAFETDELGGIIAHLGEGGEAVVESAAVRDLDVDDGPKFDRKGRQRARISDEEQEAAHPGQAPPANHRAGPAYDKARAERWLAHTLAEMPDAPGGQHTATASRRAGPEPAKEQGAAKVGAAPPQFDVTHGSVEAEAEAESDDQEADAPTAGGKRSRTATEILRAIRRQKRDEAASKEQSEAARKAREAKAAADEIERRIRGSAEGLPSGPSPRDSPGGGVQRNANSGEGESAVVAGAGQDVALQAAPKARRHRSEDLEAVVTTSEELSGELELTLDPVREEAPTSREAREAHEAVAGLKMLDPEDPALRAGGDAGPVAQGAPAPGKGPEDVASAPAVADGATTAGTAPAPALDPAPSDGAPLEAQRDVGPEDVVVAGPSTDTPGTDPEEAELSDNDRKKIRKRLQEGWNRL